MTGLRPPLGQGAALATWLRRARSLSLPHAMIVEGSRGVGKSTVIRWLAAALLCPSDLDESEPCGACRTCVAVGADAHADLHLVDRAHDDADRRDQKKSFYVIKIDQLRQVQERLARHAVSGRARVLVIADADCMEEPAQNALLKTLEEPGEATFVLLEATRPEKLLPTVRSRAQRLRVLPLSAAAIERQLQKSVGAEFDIARAVAVADGSLGMALEAGTERAVQLHDLVQAMLVDTKSLRPVATARAVLADCKDRHSEVEAAHAFLGLLRAELRVRRDRVAEAAGDSYPAASAEPWTTWLELALAAEQDLDSMIPPEQTLVACLLQFDRSGPR
ncbi:MAG: AAA family ATPase [Planctomycetes bacterium]|nr:AAA family ATPase [Planctomycetota bacterium]